MPNDEVAGVFDVIDAQNTAHDPVEPTEVGDNAQAEGGESETQTQEETSSTETGQSEEGQTQTTEGSESQGSEEQKTKTQTESGDSKESKPDETSQNENKTDAEFKDWQKDLPIPPPDYNGKKPEYDEEGRITNMTPQEYQQYIVEEAKVATRKENYQGLVESRALDIAETIIPDIKTNAAVRRLVENTRISSILQGTPIDTVQAALTVREALGLAPERIQAAKTEGAQNAKASITVQKNAALETGSTQQPDEKVTQENDLVKRVRRGDNNAFAELLGVWEEKGII